MSSGNIKEITRVFVLTRVLIVFAVIPAIRQLWRSNKVAPADVSALVIYSNFRYQACHIGKGA